MIAVGGPHEAAQRPHLQAMFLHDSGDFFVIDQNSFSP
jgi:hypothetical protein